MGKLTAAELEAYKVDRTGWGPGPWDNEPDRVEWRAEGYACLAIRHPTNGHFCGYVGVPLTHPVVHDHDAADTLTAHGGVNYAFGYGAPCVGFVCHVAQPGEPDPVHWFGFDCAHAMRDRMPGMEALGRQLEAEAKERGQDFPTELFDSLSYGAVYRELWYVREEVESLARQLRALDR